MPISISATVKPASPVLLKPLRPSFSLVKRPSADAIRPYVTDVHTKPRPAVVESPTSSVAVFAVERSNAGASIEDLKQVPTEPSPRPVPPTPAIRPPDNGVPIKPEEGPTPPPLPALPAPETPSEKEITVEDPTEPPYLPPSEPLEQEWPVPPQVHNTKIPTYDDGLAGNRQVALTPFPNLNVQTGPLDRTQLPWTQVLPQERPFSFTQTMEFQSAAGFLESNGGDDFDYGWYNSFQFALPFWREKGVGVQFGATAEPTTFPQVLSEVTFGAFRRAVWSESPADRMLRFARVSWGFGFDGLFDSENRVFVGQHRAQLAYAVAPNRELGMWGTIPLGSEVARAATEPDVQIGTTAHVAFYYRHVWPSELDGTLFVGAAESPGGFLFGGYVSYRLTSQTAWFLQGVRSFTDEGTQSLYSGIRVYFYPLADYSQISGNPQNRYRPFLPVADHINLQVRKTTP
ncbi:hypothetical protein K2X85_11245 [bacterium]|nr:hypothetical protein [bacterium]